jgi:sterol desaturase/sphingolipid hydroxylase (fatty acid hydroxylase superfamily)
LILCFYLFSFQISQLNLFLALRIWETVDAHSGYRIPFSPWTYLSGAVNHDLHHSANLGNYGLFGFWDWICGTRTVDLIQKKKK